MLLTAPVDPVAVAATGDVALTVHVRNNRDIVDRFVAAVTGVDALDVRSEAVSLFPDAEADIALRFRLGPTAVAGPVAADVAVVSQADGARASVPVTLVVPTRRMLGLDVAPSSLTGRSRAATTVVLRNRGNIAVEVLLAAADAAGALRMDLGADLLEVAPRQTVSVPLLVSGPRRLVGVAVPQLFAVTAATRTGEPLAQAAGTFTIRPLLPQWVRALAPLLAVLLVWAAILLVAVQKAIRSAVPAEAAVHGRVVSQPPLSAPVSGALVEALREGGSSAPAASATAKADGSFSLDVPPGEYHLRATAKGFDATKADAPGTVKVKNGRKSPVQEIRLTGLPGSIAGAVDLPGAKENVVVAAEELDADGNPVAGAAGGGGGATTTTIAMRPAAFFADAPDGGDGSGGAGGSGSGGSTSTTTTVPDTRPALPASSIAVAVTDSNGAFVLPDLPTPGRYRLHAIRTAFAEATADVALAPGEQKAGVAFTLEPLPATVVGSVLVGGAPTGGVAVTVSNGKTTFTTTTLSSPAADVGVGGFSVAGVPPGSWTVSATSGSQTTTVAVVLAPAERHLVPPLVL